MGQDKGKGKPDRRSGEDRSPPFLAHDDNEPPFSNRGVTIGKNAKSTPPHSLWELGFQILQSVSLSSKKCVTLLERGVAMNGQNESFSY